MASMLDKARAEELVDGLDLDRVFACPACLFELAWEIHLGRTPHWQTVGRVAGWNWVVMRLAERMSEEITHTSLE
jgi:hypothetical protein